MVRKRYARDPLFYIQQPKIKKAEAPMQHNYTTPKKAKPNKQRGDNNFSPLISTRGNNFEQFQNPQPAAESERLTDTKTETSDVHEQPGNDTEDAREEENKNRPKFKDMSIAEKIDYFINIPSHIPKLKCEVKTEDRSYRGIMIEREDEVILLRTGKRKFSIPIEDIIEIRMLGM
ncbi:hypothetical protein F3157_16445 [Virgibacillus dakarensis]|nr:hypothetical protein [Virgibacillus dakarensis]